MHYDTYVCMYHVGGNFELCILQGYIRASHKCAKGGPLLCGARCNPLKFIHDIHSVIPKQKRFCHMADGYVTNNESLISLKSFVQLSPPSPQPGSGCVNCLYRHHILYLWDIQLTVD